MRRACWRPGSRRRRPRRRAHAQKAGATTASTVFSATDSMTARTMPPSSRRAGSRPTSVGSRERAASRSPPARVSPMRNASWPRSRPATASPVTVATPRGYRRGGGRVGPQPYRRYCGGRVRVGRRPRGGGESGGGEVPERRSGCGAEADPGGGVAAAGWAGVDPEAAVGGGHEATEGGDRADTASGGSAEESVGQEPRCAPGERRRIHRTARAARRPTVSAVTPAAPRVSPVKPPRRLTARRCTPTPAAVAARIAVAAHGVGRPRPERRRRADRWRGAAGLVPSPGTNAAARPVLRA